MKGQDGFTAAEALAALAILGLAIGGLTTSMALISAGQRTTRAQLEQSMLERAVDQRLELLLAHGAPFRSDQPSLTGDGQSLELSCESVQRCEARIESGVLLIRSPSGAETKVRLPAGEKPRFVYIGSYSAALTWPP